ncbi:hypothetical protein MMC25_004012 [Agyrium rufum]|nr:hypothetical protein [Agyrium rufum]
MAFSVKELKSDAELEELVRVEFAAYETPQCNLKNLFFSILNPSIESRKEVMKEAVERQIQWHKGDPTSRWITVRQNDNGRMLGAALWHFNDHDPYAEESDEECTWFAEGDDRKTANGLMELFLTPRMTFMRKPHAFLDICFVDPGSRRAGIGSALLQWGLSKADEMGLESYIDATADGKPFYQALGFTAADKVDFSIPKPNPRQKELAEYLLPFSFWPMWRPVRGDFKNGDVLEPWK